MATLVVAVLVALVVPVGAARASGDAAADLTRWIGEERAAAGIAGLQVASDLVQVATRHSQRMAEEGRLHHNEALSSEVDGWERVTENVGYGPDARSVHDALMASSSHRANILDAGVTQVGVGVAFTDGTLWVTQVFRRPTSSAPASPEPQAPTAEPEPQPAAPAPTATPPPPPPRRRPPRPRPPRPRAPPRPGCPSRRSCWCVTPWPRLPPRTWWWTPRTTGRSRPPRSRWRRA